ncbi:carbohydrate ABC transporter permease [Herbiconiux flava]|uniref:Multiple sugar transport system permease protein n=1 Tax=Herbiconiux flava TaxID=881268 RepID=A0A852SK14_9MICO|nr:sugar ABC transporter permease [Herbiconiux flava]NYD69920.1 multiple sugar transport system permease protein [Herbiconiux flava]GLK16669.1 sugar ABC transporter permease [Herbiconiux flava]
MASDTTARPRASRDAGGVDGSAAAGPAPKTKAAPIRPSLRRARRRNLVAALAFLSPWIVGFLVFTLWPLIYSGYLSLTDYDVINDPSFVGLDNYAQLFADPKVALALGNTLFYAVLQIPAYVIVSLVLAVLLDRAGRASGFFRTVFFLPKMTPPVAIGVLFLLLFNGQNGLVNGALGLVGIDGPAWTTDPAWVKPGLILMSLWTVGSSVIILLAALRSVPEDVLEAARLDGANGLQVTWRVTVPLISPALFFIVIINTINALQTFDEVYTAFFGGGNTTYSNDAALFYVIYLFQQAFEFLHMGYASALAWLLFVIIMAITVVQFVVSRKVVYYEGGER